MQLPGDVDLVLQTLRVLYSMFPYLNLLSDCAPELLKLWRRFGYQKELAQDGAIDLHTSHTLDRALGHSSGGLSN
jgi:hypothetical protein